MSGEASWLTAAILLFGVVGVAAIAVIGTRLGRAKPRAIRRRLTCPASGVVYEAVLLALPGGPVFDVASCPAFEDPERIRCNKRCIAEAAPLDAD